MSKVCSSCRTEKSRTEFYARRDGSVLSECKSCVLVRRKTHACVNRERVRACNRASWSRWRSKNVVTERERVRTSTAVARAAGLKPNWNTVKPERHAASEAARRARKLHATPAWADMTAISLKYQAAKRISVETGIEHHVDHIVPLLGIAVCGLHVDYNLQVIPALDNIAKGNRVPAIAEE